MLRRRWMRCEADQCENRACLSDPVQPLPIPAADRRRDLAARVWTRLRLAQRRRCAETFVRGRYIIPGMIDLVGPGPS
ncbi:hypothetical protein THIOKS12940016 [Thiocapsa sp. KS1]|nr:hypothetical protein THIOKS12940016 [Thiocapsa sp. KS1]